jgi:hypothetical protein
MNHGNNALLRTIKFGNKPQVKRYPPNKEKETIEIPVMGGYRVQRAEQRNMDRYNEKKALRSDRHEEITVKFIPTPEVTPEVTTEVAEA